MIFTPYSNMSFSKPINPQRFSAPPTQVPRQMIFAGTYFLGKMPDSSHGLTKDDIDEYMIRIVNIKHSGFLFTFTAIYGVIYFSSKYCSVGPHADYGLQCLYEYLGCVMGEFGFSTFVNYVEDQHIVIGFEMINPKLGEHAASPVHPYFVVTTAFQGDGEGGVELDKKRLCEFCTMFKLPMAEFWVIDGSTDFCHHSSLIKYADCNQAFCILDEIASVIAPFFRPHNFQGNVCEGLIAGLFKCEELDKFKTDLKTSIDEYNKVMIPLLPIISEFFQGINQHPILNGIIDRSMSPKIFIKSKDDSVESVIMKMPIPLKISSEEALQRFKALYLEIDSEKARKYIRLLDTLIPLAQSGNLTVNACIFTGFRDDDKLRIAFCIKLEHDDLFGRVNAIDGQTYLRRNHMLIEPTPGILTNYESSYEKIRQDKLKCLLYFFCIVILRNGFVRLLRRDMDEIQSLINNFLKNWGIDVKYHEGIIAITNLYVDFIANLPPDIVSNFKINFLKIKHQFLDSIGVLNDSDALLHAFLNPPKLPGATNEVPHPSQLRTLVLIVPKHKIDEILPNPIKPEGIQTKPKKKEKKIKEEKPEITLSDEQEKLLTEFIQDATAAGFKLKKHVPNSQMLPGIIYLFSSPPPGHMLDFPVLDLFDILPGQWYTNHSDANVLGSITPISVLDSLLEPVRKLKTMKKIRVFIPGFMPPGTGKSTIARLMAMYSWYILASDEVENMEEEMRKLIQKVLIDDDGNLLQVYIDKNMLDEPAFIWLRQLLENVTGDVRVEIEIVGFLPERLDKQTNWDRVLSRDNSHPLSIPSFMEKYKLPLGPAREKLYQKFNQFFCMAISQATQKFMKRFKFISTNIFYRKMEPEEMIKELLQLIDYALAHPQSFADIIYGDDDAPVSVLTPEPPKPKPNTKLYARIVMHGDSDEHITIVHPGEKYSDEQFMYLQRIVGGSVTCFTNKSFDCTGPIDTSSKHPMFVSFRTIIPDSFTGFDPSMFPARNYHVTDNKSLVGCLPSKSSEILNDIMTGTKSEFDIKETPIDVQLNGMIVISYV